MPRLVISSCGISILANQANQEIKNLLLRNANRCENEIYGPEKATIDGFLTGCQTRLKAERFASSKDLCAELNSILTYYKGDISDSQADIHYLIHTDTYLGERAAALVQAHLLQHFPSCQLQTFHKLRVNSIVDFQHGLAELIKWCEQTLPSFRQKQVKVVFNLSGGFKSIQGWLQTLGMFYSDEIVYIFESHSEMLRIPRIPVAIDTAAIQIFREHLAFFRRLACQGTCNSSDCPLDIPESFFFNLDNVAELSPWANLLWENCKAKIYREALYPAPSPQILLTEKFKNAAASLSNDRLTILNERIDDLVRYLDTNQMLKRLDFKALKGNPCPPSTHECDAWADQGAWRIFAHFDNDHRLILDNLAEGLH